MAILSSPPFFPVIIGILKDRDVFSVAPEVTVEKSLRFLFSPGIRQSNQELSMSKLDHFPKQNH